MKQYSEKETRILDAAAEMFSNNPFHKVLLSDVAGAASVGKGTLYLYFKSKDDLYYAVLLRGFSVLIEKIRKNIAQDDLTPVEQLTCFVRDLAQHLFFRSTNVELLANVFTLPSDGEWQEKRLELWSIVESILVRGIEEGYFEEPNPRLAAQYITGLVRSVCLFRPANVDPETICDHACEFVLRAVRNEN